MRVPRIADTISFPQIEYLSLIPATNQQKQLQQRKVTAPVFVTPHIELF